MIHRRAAKRALLVEDDEVLQLLLEHHLSAVGFTVSLTGSLEEARCALARDRFDLIALDDLLPDGTGAELLDALPSPRPPVLVCSARTSELAKQADHVLEKPFAIDDLRRVLAAVDGPLTSTLADP